jgi:hypothetical protein
MNARAFPPHETEMVEHGAWRPRGTIFGCHFSFFSFLPSPKLLDFKTANLRKGARMEVLAKIRAILGSLDAWLPEGELFLGVNFHNFHFLETTCCSNADL